MCFSMEEAELSPDLLAFFASAPSQESAGDDFRSAVFSPAEDA